MSKIIVIVGPTCSGKTYLSIEIAKKLNAEIISCDSRYIYKEPLIATAKVTKEEMQGITHHFVDIISLNDDYSIYNYQIEARKILDELIKNNKNIVITGGSGLYLKALLYNYELNEVIHKPLDLSNYTNKELKDKADSIDPLNSIHINNRHRLERFLINYNDTGKINNYNKKDEKLYDFETIGLEVERSLLYSKINDRVDSMINKGLLKEANNLYNANLKHFNEVIGYKELIPYFEGKCSLETSINEIKKDTRNYAKRQMTWFKNQMKDTTWYNIDYKESTYKKIIENV